MKKILFKLIMHGDHAQTVTYFIHIDVNDYQSAIIQLHKAINDRIEPGFFDSSTKGRKEKSYKMFWMDDKHDAVYIKTWWDLHNYATFFAAQGEDYIKLYVGSSQK